MKRSGETNAEPYALRNAVSDDHMDEDECLLGEGIQSTCTV